MTSFTRKAIMDSCTRLLDERPVDKITVKDIVEDCGINRNTFYYHFEDLPSLISAILNEDVEQLLRENAQVDSLWACLESAIGFTLRHRRAALHLYNSANRNIFEQHLFEICRHVATRYVEKACGDMPVSTDDRRIIIESYKCECFGQVINWLNGGLKEDLSRDMIRMCKLREGSTMTLLKRSLTL